MTKHRKDWTEWKKKREAQLRQEREFRQIMARSLQDFADSAFRSPLMETLLRPRPIFGGATMQVPIRYEKLK